jgi:nicotinamide mononucleotide (NMN) deamidase PncC
MKTAMLLCLALIPAVAVAAGNNGTDKQAKKGNGLICRDVAETGSRLSSQRICMTKEQWEESRRQAREAVEHGQNNQIPPKGY